MSEENVEVVRRMYRAMEAGDYEAADQLADPSIEWIPDRQRVGEGPVRGRKNVRRFFRDRAETFTQSRWEMERVWVTDDQVLVFLRASGVGKSRLDAYFAAQLERAAAQTRRATGELTGEQLASRD